MTIASFLPIYSLTAQNDLSIGNISAGWDTYNASTGMITGVYFDVLNNENNNPGSFDIKVYLVDPNDYSTTYTVWTYTDADGQNGNTVVTYSSIDIDFNNTSGIPAGQYRLAVCVDPDNAISETDENNNCLFISTQGNNLTYNPGTAGMNDVAEDVKLVLYPNPARDQVWITYHPSFENNVLEVMDLTGKMVKTTVLNNASAQMDLSGLTPGLYIYRVLSTDGKLAATGKLVKE